VKEIDSKNNNYKKIKNKLTSIKHKHHEWKLINVVTINIIDDDNRYYVTI